MRGGRQAIQFKPDSLRTKNIRLAAPLWRLAPRTGQGCLVSKHAVSRVCRSLFVVAGLVGGLAVPATGPAAAGPSVTAPVAARPADAVVDSFGVNIHLHHTDSVYYSHYDSVIRPRLVELGVRHVRDGAQTYPGIGPDSFFYQRCRDLAAHGIRFDLITGMDTWWGDPTDYSMLDDVYSWCDGAVDSFEGVNEPDRQGVPNWVDVIRDAQPRLWDTVKNNPAIRHVAVVGPSVTSEEAATELGDLSGWLDHGNIHNYLSGRNPETTGWGAGGYGSLRYNLTYVAAPVSGAKPVVSTETGYHNALASPDPHRPAPEHVAARYFPRLLLHQFANGVARTYSYELIDAGTDAAYHEHNFGLLRNDGTPKPGFHAVRNLVGLLADPGPAFTPGSLDYAIDGDTAGLHQALLQKRDGTFYLALWLGTQSWDPGANEELPGASRPLTVRIGTPRPAATAHLIGDDGALRSTALPVTDNAVTLTVHDEVTLLELPPSGGPVADGTYRVSSKLSDRVLDVAYCGLDNGSNVLIWDWVAAPCQQWLFQHQGGGVYKITDVNSGRALDVAGCATHDGANVQIWDYWGAGCQHWRIEDAGDGSYRLLAVNSGKALDVAGCSAELGANVQIWWYWGGDCQRWTLQRLG